MDLQNEETQVITAEKVIETLKSIRGKIQLVGLVERIDYIIID